MDTKSNMPNSSYSRQHQLLITIVCVYVFMSVKMIVQKGDTG